MNVTPNTNAIYTSYAYGLAREVPRNVSSSYRDIHIHAHAYSLLRVYMHYVSEEGKKERKRERKKEKKEEEERRREGRLESEMIAEFSRAECGGGDGEGVQERSLFRDRRTRISNYLVPGKGERGREEKSRRDTRIATEFRHRIAVKPRCSCRCNRDVVRFDQSICVSRRFVASKNCRRGRDSVARGIPSRRAGLA